MKTPISDKSRTSIVAVFVLGAAILAIGSGKVYAQGHDQRREKADFDHHQRDERIEYGKWAVRHHQRAEKGGFRQQEVLGPPSGSLDWKGDKSSHA